MSNGSGQLLCASCGAAIEVGRRFAAAMMETGGASDFTCPACRDVQASGDVRDGSVEPATEVETTAHTYVLRPGFEVTLLLPMDLSRAEADRLGRFIATLPFD